MPILGLLAAGSSALLFASLAIGSFGDERYYELSKLLAFMGTAGLLAMIVSGFF